MLQGAVGDEQWDRNLAPRIGAGRSCTPLDVVSGGSVPVLGHTLGLVCCLGSWQMHGELLLLKIWHRHLRGQILASCLSPLLTCVGP